MAAEIKWEKNEEKKLFFQIVIKKSQLKVKRQRERESSPKSYNVTIVSQFSLSSFVEMSKGQMALMAADAHNQHEDFLSLFLLITPIFFIFHYPIFSREEGPNNKALFMNTDKEARPLLQYPLNPLCSCPTM